jgi:hypothetical protein
MARTVIRSGFRIFVVAIALIGPACAWLPADVDPELVALEGALKLEIAQVNPLQNGSAEFTFKLLNQGPETAKACLGPSRSVWYTSSGSSGVSGTSVDHPGCMREFTLQPKSDMTWREELKVAAVSWETLEVQVDLQIVNPRRCRGVGCSAIELRSSRYLIPRSR